MFTNISWSSYLLFVALLLAVWYLFVGVRYYFEELQALASGKVGLFRPMVSTEGQSVTIERSKNHVTESDQPAANVAPTAEMEMLSSRLMEAIASAADRAYGREEFLFLLQLTLKEFPSLKESSFRSAIDELILSECEKHSIVRLSADELRQLWIEVA